MLRRLNEVSEELDSCSECKTGYLILTEKIVVKGESAGGFADIGTRRVFRCDKCKKRQVRVARREYVIIGDDSENHLAEERLHLQKKKAIELATVVKEQVRQTKQMDVSLTHEELVLKRNPVTESRRTNQKPVESRTEIKIPLNKEEIEIAKRSYVIEDLRVF